MFQMFFTWLYFIAFRIEYRGPIIAFCFHIFPVPIIRNRLIGKTSHDLRNNFPSVMSAFPETVYVLYNEVHYITTLGSVPSEISLCRLVLWILDDNFIRMNITIIQYHLNVFAYAGTAVDRKSTRLNSSHQI